MGDGSHWGISLQYKAQQKPNGLAEAFILGEEFIGEEAVCLILGDNIFYGVDFSEQLEAVKQRTSLGSKATIFGYTVNDPNVMVLLSMIIKGKPSLLKKNLKSQKAMKRW